MPDTFRILTVCTANICRSPAAETLLRTWADTLRPGVVEVSSAGVAALEGRPACDLSAAVGGEYIGGRYPALSAEPAGGSHRSRRLTAEHLNADLILALDRSHRSAAAQLNPFSRSRTFTLRQAAMAARVLLPVLESGHLPDGATAMPEDLPERLRWLVAELDAARGLVPVPEVSEQGFDPLDVPDPHVLGYQMHPTAIELIETATDEVTHVMAATVGYPG